MYQNEATAYSLLTAESMFNIDEEFAMALYEKAIAKVNDSNRQEIARLLKEIGCNIDVLASNV